MIVSAAMQRALTQLETQGHLSGVRRSTIRALETRKLISNTPGGYQRMAETLDTPRPNRLITQWYDQFRITPTRDVGQSDYVFWDRALHGKAVGLEISGAFLKPLSSKIAAWTLGAQPKFKFSKAKTQQLFSDWWGKHMADIIRAFEDASGKGDAYMVINPPDFKGDLPITVVPPNVVTPLVDENDYSRVIGWRISETHAHPSRPGDSMTIVDDYTATERVHKVYKSGTLMDTKTYKNLIGRVSVVHIAYNRGSDEMFGHPAGEGLIEILHRYGEVMEAAIIGNIKQGRPTPVLEKMGSMSAIREWWAEFGRQETRTLPDGTTESYWVMDLSSDNAITLGGDATFKYAFPGNFSADTVAILGLLFYLMLQQTEIPEFIWGNAIASSKASAESQLPPFVKFIEKIQGQCLYWINDLTAIVVGYLSLFERGVAADDDVLVQWPKLTTQDGALTLNAIKLGLDQGLLTDETALALMPLDIDDPAAEVAKAKQESQERQAQFDARQSQQDIPLPDVGSVAQMSGYGSVISEAEHSGVMVAFYLDDTAANILTNAAQEAGVKSIIPAGEMHMTLAFLGDSAALQDNKEAIMQAVGDFAAGEFSIRGVVSGVGRFVNSGNTDALYASFDAPDLPDFRQRLIETLEAAGIVMDGEHGFTPHITLAYLPKEAPMPDVRLQPFDLVFNRIVLAWGDNLTTFDLKGMPAA